MKYKSSWCKVCKFLMDQVKSRYYNTKNCIIIIIRLCRCRSNCFHLCNNEGWSVCPLVTRSSALDVTTGDGKVMCSLWSGNVVYGHNDKICNCLIQIVLHDCSHSLMNLLCSISINITYRVSPKNLAFGNKQF